MGALQEHCILLKEGDDVLHWGYSQRGNFRIKEAYNIRIRIEDEEEKIWGEFGKPTLDQKWSPSVS